MAGGRRSRQHCPPAHRPLHSSSSFSLSLQLINAFCFRKGNVPTNKRKSSKEKGKENDGSITATRKRYLFAWDALTHPGCLQRDPAGGLRWLGEKGTVAGYGKKSAYEVRASACNTIEEKFAYQRACLIDSQHRSVSRLQGKNVWNNNTESLNSPSLDSSGCVIIEGFTNQHWRHFFPSSRI